MVALRIAANHYRICSKFRQAQLCGSGLARVYRASVLRSFTGTRAQHEGSSDVQVQKTGDSEHSVERRTPEQGSITGRRPSSLLVTPGVLSGFPAFGRLGRVMQQMEEEMNAMLSIFDAPLSERVGFQSFSDLASLAVDVKETDQEFLFTADIPGLSKDDIKVQVSPDNVLTISGERKHEAEESQEGFRRVERSYGKFLRRFQLPDNVDVDGVKAKAEHGVLKLVVPKTDVEEHKTIDVKIE